MGKSFRRAQEEKSFLRNLKGRRAKFIRHILRHNGLVKRITEGTIEGKNHRGRPRLDYMKQLMVDMNCTSYCELKRNQRSVKNGELLPTLSLIHI